MRMLKKGGHRLFENDPETVKVVAEMLSNLEKHGMDAVRKYSRQLDDWDPPDFQLSDAQIDAAIGKLDEQIIKDTDFCQNNVRQFAVGNQERFGVWKSKHCRVWCWDTSSSRSGPPTSRA